MWKNGATRSWKTYSHGSSGPRKGPLRRSCGLFHCLQEPRGRLLHQGGQDQGRRHLSPAPHAFLSFLASGRGTCTQHTALRRSHGGPQLRQHALCLNKELASKLQGLDDSHGSHLLAHDLRDPGGPLRELRLREEPGQPHHGAAQVFSAQGVAHELRAALLTSKEL